MDNRGISIAITVVVIALFIRGIPQRVYGLVHGGGAESLGSVLSSIPSQVSSTSAPSDAIAPSAGSVTNSQTTGGLAGTALAGIQPAVNAVASAVALHQSALAHPGIDSALDDLSARLPATNDPHQQIWVQIFRNLYGSGASVQTAAGQATKSVGWSPFG